MATYKVLQDIEAEDKLIGPLTFRQFVYAGIAVLGGYLTFLVVSKGAAFLAVVFLPPSILAGFFAWPWSKDQPTEIWALARIRFLVKPRKRIWDQTGIKELVTITAPKKIEQYFSNGLSEGEVRSRLKALASTIDSRGWAIKNVNVNMYGQPALIMSEPNNDRLISAASLPQTVSSVDIQASDDILDEQNNRVAKEMEDRLEASSRARRQRVINEMRDSDLPPPPTPRLPQNQPANDYWFLNQPTQNTTAAPAGAVTFNTQIVSPRADVPQAQVAAPPIPQAAEPTIDEESLIKQLEEQRRVQDSVSTYSHLHTIQPLSAAPQAQVAAAPVAGAAWQGQQPPQAVSPVLPVAQTPVPEPPKPVILDLASNDDLDVATIAREAHKRRELPEDEVVITLH